MNWLKSDPKKQIFGADVWYVAVAMSDTAPSMSKRVLYLAYITAVAALDNGLGRVPQMGYNSWYMTSEHKYPYHTKLSSRMSHAILPNLVLSNLFVLHRYDWTCNMDEAQLKETVDAIVEHDLVSYGYTYFNLDDCWSKGRHPNGSQYADPAHFPSVCLLTTQ